MFLSPIQLNISTLLCVFSQILLKSTKPVSSGDHYNFIELGIIAGILICGYVGVYAYIFLDKHWKNKSEPFDAIPGPCDECQKKIEKLEQMRENYFNECTKPATTITRLQNWWTPSCPESKSCEEYQKLIDSVLVEAPHSVNSVCTDCQHLFSRLMIKKHQGIGYENMREPVVDFFANRALKEPPTAFKRVFSEMFRAVLEHINLVIKKVGVVVDFLTSFF